MRHWTENLPGYYERYAGEDGNKFYVEKHQDVEPILERNRWLRNADDGWNADRSGRRIASIPLVVIKQWRNEGFDPFDPNNMQELKRRLNSSEYAKFRTSEGSV